MRGEEGYSRFFAYTNLFIASMVVLVLADNLLLMYLGWEGVGLCSYLLIGFYYTDPKNGAAAMKAFVVTRVGDVFLAFALFILYNELGTLNFREMVELAPAHFADGNNMLMWATLMLLGGAVGKSAQLPLQTWLADAMAGPTPVSALIHAATMVTAGVYLIARTHGLFLMTPEVLHLVGIVGAVTLLLAGFAALVQTDIKRVLAYSTMSQIGYMFLALGVQAWDAAIFHLMTHAFFKALLFWHPVPSFWPAITNRTSSRWAVCVNLFRWFISASWWAAQHCRHCRWSLRASSVRMRSSRVRWRMVISI